MSIATLVFVVLDLLIYIDIVNSGLLVKWLGPTEAELGATSFPPYWFLWARWIDLHQPTSKLLPMIPEKLDWLVVLNDILILGSAILIFRSVRVCSHKTRHNKASDATSEPAPGAASSAHQD